MDKLYLKHSYGSVTVLSEENHLHSGGDKETENHQERELKWAVMGGILTEFSWSLYKSGYSAV